jgi:hypothetical protein
MAYWSKTCRRLPKGEAALHPENPLAILVFLRSDYSGLSTAFLAFLHLLLIFIGRIDGTAIAWKLLAQTSSIRRTSMPGIHWCDQLQHLLVSSTHIERSTQLDDPTKH